MSSIRKTPEYLRRAYNLRGEVAEAVEPVEPVGSAEPAEAAAAVAVRRGELAAGARPSTLRLRYALTRRMVGRSDQRTHHGRLRVHTGVF